MALTMSKNLRVALALSIRLKGNIGPFTFRRQPRTGTIVYYERRLPGAPSTAQLNHRVKFNRAYVKWDSLTQAQRDDWNLAANRASTRMIGSHLFMRVWWRQDSHTIDQFALHFNLALALPGP